jgi:hypothetical protein
MKRSIIAIIAIQIGALGIFGQGNSTNIGIVAGPSIFSLRGNYEMESENSTMLSYSLGLSIEKYVSERISLRSDLLFESHNAQNSTSDASSPQTNGSLEFESLTIPIHSHFYFGNKNRASIGLGIFSSFLLAANERSLEPDNPVLEVSTTNHYTIVNFGFSGSIGYKVPISNKIDLKINLEDNFGIRDTYIGRTEFIDPNHTPDIDFNLKTNNIKLMFILTYLL